VVVLQQAAEPLNANLRRLAITMSPSIRTSQASFVIASFVITVPFRRKENFRKNSAPLISTRDEKTTAAYDLTRRKAASLNKKNAPKRWAACSLFFVSQSPPPGNFRRSATRT
jgi:hypothetical protein